ncbi:uncharacterized protein MYCFIDRAFT_84145 [Pseudocercospora fijiensis CIRAD86]|uniref:Uncharacterized protein n=1 Tax=Pseudocercospora fijiensis (strain CIRAD86) TaxID=383855 RepID=M3B394_PSEFD|nr:uncharacterized protein MYCFIDRAFT_84145 [Pseudocercospora fijiensis CIRAD86]EME83842.1 hypothetical protein MYCFIDRAFT_84145 [Pseudocercospora fijiensis CIRAD86]
MSTSPHRTFQIKTSASNSPTISIQIRELAGIKAENLSLATWGASAVLANLLHRWKTAEWVKTLQKQKEPPQIFDPIPILELGAGTGLTGLTASNLWSLPAILTDLPSILPGIDVNISLNSKQNQCLSGSLDWTSPKTLHLPTLSTPPTSASIILAADTCYTTSHPVLIASTVFAWLKKDRNARAIFCYPLRMAYVEHARKLWEEMEGKGFVCVEEGRETSGEETYGEFERDVPYEWSCWGWKEFHEEAVARREEEEKGQGVWMSW